MCDKQCIPFQILYAGSFAEIAFAYQHAQSLLADHERTALMEQHQVLASTTFRQLYGLTDGLLNPVVQDCLFNFFNQSHNYQLFFALVRRPNDGTNCSCLTCF